MLPIIRHNAERLRELHGQIDETFKHRSESAEHYEAWSKACDQFHRDYDKLAFPGGLEEGLKKIKNGDIQTIEIALEYLEDTPYCFRSQYVATYLRRALNKVELSEPFLSRFISWKNKMKIRTSSSSQPR